MPAERPRLLILGGTGEASELARALEGHAFDVVSSLAGRVERPAPLPGIVRIGGFGGADGLAAWLRAERIDIVVDATHPFAATISAHARAACDGIGLPRLILERPAWRPVPGDRWIEVADAAQAAGLLPGLGRRALLTVGHRDLAAFTARGVAVARVIDPPRQPFPFEIVTNRGPFDIESERRLFAERRIDVLVTKASGGQATAAKLTVARELSLPVLMLRRPPPEPGERATSVAEALAWLRTRAERR